MSIASDCLAIGWPAPAELKPETGGLDQGAGPVAPHGPDGGPEPIRPITIEALVQNFLMTDAAPFLHGPAQRAASASPARSDPPGKSESKTTPSSPSQTTGLRRGRAAGLRQGDRAGNAPSPNVYAALGARAAATTDPTARLQPATKALLFYFDFVSPHGYLAALRVDTVAARHGLAVEWRPLPLGTVFGAAERQPTPLDEFKSGYLLHDCGRTARRYGAAFRLPETFPFDTQPACRAFYHVRREDAAGAKRFARSLLHAAFGAGGNIAAAETIRSAAIAAGLGIERRTAPLHSPAGDRELNLEMQAALRRGVFGTPFFIVDGEAFWGNDRLDDIAAWLARGGW